MRTFRFPILDTMIALAVLSAMACGGNGSTPSPNDPTPPAPTVTANAYILPDAVSQNDFAFGDEPVVTYRGERLRWVNLDALAHTIVADSPAATDFHQTSELAGHGGEQSFVMNRLGTTRIHCTIHPNMTGTLIVREH